MDFSKTSNPALGKSLFQKAASMAQGDVMTINGVINKTMILFLVLLASSAFTWRFILSTDNYATAFGFLFAGLIGGLIAAIVTIVKKDWAAVTAPIYVIFEGLLLGSISLLFNAQYPGIITQAVLLTLGVFMLMLFAYKTKVIKPTKRFMTGVVVATGAVAAVYFFSFILRLFMPDLPYIHEMGFVGILFSLAVVVIAALNFILDFKFIEDGVEAGAPKYMEWYSSFGLMVTLIWLYIEILRLLSILNRD